MGQTDVNKYARFLGDHHVSAAGEIYDTPPLEFRFHHGDKNLDVTFPALDPVQQRILLGACRLRGPDPLHLPQFDLHIPIDVAVIRETLVRLYGAPWVAMEAVLGQDQTRRAIFCVARFMLSFPG